jgi:hypothetical protein
VARIRTAFSGLVLAGALVSCGGEAGTTPGNSATVSSVSISPSSLVLQIGQTMTLTATILYQRQYAAMLEQVKGYGGSLAKFMATQSAVPLLAEDYAAIDVFVQETLAPGLPVPGGRRRRGRAGSNDPKQVGQVRRARGSSSPTTTPRSPCARTSFRLARFDFGYDPVPEEADRAGASRHLRGAAHARRQPRLRVARDPDARDGRGGGGRHLLLARRIAAPIRVIKLADELAHGRYDGASARPAGRVRRALRRVQQDRRSPGKPP